MNQQKITLTWPSSVPKEERRSKQAAGDREYRCEIGHEEGMPEGRVGAVQRPIGAGPIWRYELDGSPSEWEYWTADEALEELRRKLNSREIYIPTDCQPGASLVLSFHGRGREGESEISRWEETAEREKFIVLAPTSTNAQRYWAGTEPDQQKLRKMLYETIANWSVGHRRIYLAGHSAGGYMALDLAFGHPEFYAAAVAHEPPYLARFLNLPFSRAARKIPISIWVGQNESNCVEAKMLTRALGEHYQTSIELMVLENHGHLDYHTRPKLPDEMWAFLKQHTL